MIKTLPEITGWLCLRLVLLSLFPGDRQGLPDAETLDALDGYTLSQDRQERLDRADYGRGAVVGGGSEKIGGIEISLLLGDVIRLTSPYSLIETATGFGLYCPLAN